MSRGIVVIITALLLGCAMHATPAPVVVFGDSHAVQLAAVTGGAAVNAGVPSERVAIAHRDLGEWMLTGEERIASVLATPIRQLVIVEGTNDVFEAVVQHYCSNVWLVDFEAALERVVISAKQAHVPVITLTTIPPQRKGGRRKRDEYADLIPLANQRIVRVARTHHVRLVDVYALVYPRMDTYVSDDDVHLTPFGYSAVWRLLQ